MIKQLSVILFLTQAAASFADLTEGFESGPTGFINGSYRTIGNTPGGDDVIFDSGTWHAINASPQVGALGWFGNGAFTTFDPLPAHTGFGALSANYASTAGVGSTGMGDIDLYMMSPVLTFNNGDTISFWTRTRDNPATWADRLLLKLSTAGTSTDVSDFTTTLVAVNPNLNATDYPGDYTEFTATLSGLSGPTSGRFAFNYNVTDGGELGTNSFIIGIDDVSFVQAVPEPTSLAAVGLGLIALLRRKRNK